MFRLNGSIQVVPCGLFPRDDKLGLFHSDSSSLCSASIHDPVCSKRKVKENKPKNEKRKEKCYRVSLALFDENVEDWETLVPARLCVCPRCSSEKNDCFSSQIA